MSETGNTSNIGIKEDCFAYNPNNYVNKCEALNELFCRKEKCKFYKSIKQRMKELKEGGMIHE